MPKFRKNLRLQNAESTWPFLGLGAESMTKIPLAKK